MQNKIKIWPSLINVAKTIWKSAAQLLIFIFVYSFAVAVIFKPAIRFILSLFMRVKGYPILINADIRSFFLSLGGVAVAIIMLLIAAISVYFEFSTMLHILKLGKQEEKKSLLFSLEKSLFSLSSLKDKSTFGFFLYALVFLPFFSFGIRSTILPEINIPNFIMGEVDKYPIVMVILPILIIVGVYVAMRLSMVFPLMVFEKKNFFSACKKSFQLTKENQWRILLLEFLMLLIILSAITIPTIIFMNIRGLFLLPLRAIFFLMAFLASVILPSTMICTSLVCYESLVPEFEIKTDISIRAFDIKLRRTTKNIYRKTRDFIKKHTPKWLSSKPYLLLVFLIIPIILIIDFIIPLQVEPHSPLVVGHRGSLDGVENTTEALYGAIDQGADYAEIDILLSKDGVPMVIHDVGLQRLAGSKSNVYDLTADELSKITLKSHGYEGKISTFDEICKISKDNINLLIEFKTHGYEEENIIDKVLEVVEKYELQGDVLYQSGNLNLITEFRLKAPDAKIGYIVYGYIGKFSTSKILRLNVDFLGIEESFVSSALVNSSYKAGIPIFVWTVNKAEDVEEFYEYKVDAIITDYPAKIRSALDDIEKPNQPNGDDLIIRLVNAYNPASIRLYYLLYSFTH